MKFFMGILRFFRSLMLGVLVVLPVGIAITIYMNRDYMNPAGIAMWLEYLFLDEREPAALLDWGHDTIPPPNPNIVEVAHLLRAGDHAGLEALDRRDPVVFKYFQDISPDLSDLLDAWVAARSRSALPRLARGQYWFNIGWQRRGNAYARETTRTQFDEMHEAFGRAERDYLFALGLDPSAEVAHRRLLSIYMATDRDDDMLAIWQAALDAGAGTWRLHTALFEGLSPWWSGLPGEKSVAVVRRIVADIDAGALQSTGDPAMLRGYPDQLEAALLWRGGRRDAAMARYATFIDTPSGRLFLGDYADKLYLMGRAAESLLYYVAALHVDPSQGGVWAYYARALIKLGRQEEAREALDHALALDPYDPNALRRRATLHARLGRHREALADYDAAKVYASEQPWPWSGAGGMRLTLGEDLARAVADYRRAIALDPDWPSAYRGLGMVLDKQRNCSAIPAYRAYLELCERRGNCASPPRNWTKVRWKQLADRGFCSIDGHRLEPAPAWLPMRHE